MKLSIDYNSAKYSINGYKNGQISINNEPYTCNLVVTPEKLLVDWEPDSIEQITESHIHGLIELEPEIIILGTGSKLTFPDTALMALAMQQGIGFEVMDTGSACRTFNVLSAEDRNVIAALMLI